MSVKQKPKIFCSFDQEIELEKIVPNPRNPNRHNSRQVELLAKIIDAQGWRAPIVVSDRSGFIVAGHARLAAAQELGLDSAPVNFQSFETEAEEHAHLVADNRIAELAEIDRDDLAGLLREMEGEIDLELAGFDSVSLDELIGGGDGDPVDAEPQVGKADELAGKWGTKLGQVWELGEHRLVCGDSRELDLAKFAGGGCFSFTSPPYNIGHAGKLSGNMAASNRANLYEDFNDCQTPDEWRDLVDRSIQNLLKVSAAACVNVQILAGNKIALIEWIHNIRDQLIDVAIWNKGHGPPHVHESIMGSCFEFLFFLSPEKNPSKVIPTANFQGTIQNVFNSPGQKFNEFASVHGATFPTSLAEWVVGSFSTGQTVVDPFIGTGTTLIACENLGRKCCGVDISPSYIAVTIERWHEATGKEPKLIG